MLIGLTKARSMGPVADAVERAGGSVARVFGRAEMPMALIDEPDRLILLRDQLRIVEEAAREVGDSALPARLSLGAGVPSLGPYGIRVCASATLGEALALGTTLIVDHLQTETRMDVSVRAGRAHVTYAVTDDSPVGRQKNEMLALGYILDVLRRFLGPGFVPDEVGLSGAMLQDRGAIETVLGCELRLGPGAVVSFDADLIATRNPRPAKAAAVLDMAGVPDPSDFLLCTGHLLRLGLLDRRPSIDWLCRRLGLSRRSLQRRFEAHGTSYGACLTQILIGEAKHLLSRTDRPIGRIGLDLGYADAAHFTRAFRGWTGLPPTEWRRLAAGLETRPSMGR
ncbi:AraC family transcriptional regulator ligand-binding domain-containing protein [Methylobacterium sp. SD274]|uniref:AraC family transcriptional regulator n=1 Tax=Methylobacterium sp. SD274 TaxID=2782009 RepID=UPI001A96304A|nr:AraC family transcriptional regulator [Methylobacterium sp. SD274]MBO1022663.1 AraC family transcriptional regulator ligand-binding domain-containing protein [Methylobacterium sp. SD274]